MPKKVGKREKQLDEAAHSYALRIIRGSSADWHFFDTWVYASRQRPEISALITLHSQLSDIAHSLADIYEVLNIGPQMRAKLDSPERDDQWEKLKDEYKTKASAEAAARKVKRLKRKKQTPKT